MANNYTATLTTRKAPGQIKLLRGEEVLGAVEAVTTSGRVTGQWIVVLAGKAIWGKRYASAQLAMDALVKKII